MSVDALVLSFWSYHDIRIYSGKPMQIAFEERRFSELAVFDARLYIRVRRIDEPA